MVPSIGSVFSCPLLWPAVVQADLVVLVVVRVLFSSQGLLHHVSSSNDDIRKLVLPRI